MKAAILFESLTGTTRTAAGLVAADLQQVGWSITGVSPVRRPDLQSVQDADLVVVGTWVHGLFVVGQAPWGIGAIERMPAMRGKRAVTFCTYALHPGGTLDRMEAALRLVGCDVVGGVALHRARLAEHAEEFAARLAANVPAVA
ncbi:MAG: flavodoxin family protein [Ilumatobacteraceae bacterium]